MRVRLECPHCRTRVNATAGTRVTCPQCGFQAPAALHATTGWQRVSAPVAPRVVTMPARANPVPLGLRTASVSPAPPRPARAQAVGGLLLNAVLPGAGSLSAGRRREGWLQLGMLATGLLTIPWLVGLAVVGAVWAWAVASAAQAVFHTWRGARAAAPA